MPVLLESKEQFVAIGLAAGPNALCIQPVLRFSSFMLHSYHIGTITGVGPAYSEASHS